MHEDVRGSVLGNVNHEVARELHLHGLWIFGLQQQLLLVEQAGAVRTESLQPEDRRRGMRLAL